MSKLRRIEKLYGTTTLGERGQLVVPAEARRELHVKQGEKLLVFGAQPDLLVIAKLSHVERLASRLSEQLEAIRRITRTVQSNRTSARRRRVVSKRQTT